MRKNDVLYANFICKVGEDDMIEHLNDIVVPAFVNDKYFRKRGPTSYHLIDTKVENLGTENDEDYCIRGRFVKNTVLRRTQIFDEETGELTPNEQSIESAPSAFFVLRLNGHRLIYFAETIEAPDVGAFQASIRMHLKWAWEARVRAIHEQSGDTLVSIRKGMPRPSLVINTMVGDESVRDFVERFDKITRLEIVVHERNDEQDAFELVEAVDAHRQRHGAKSARLDTRSKEGLDSDATIETIVGAGRSGNQSTKITGVDEEGSTLRGSQNDYAVVDKLSNPPAATTKKSKKLLQMLKEAAAAGKVGLGNVTENAKEVLKTVFGDQ